MYHCIRVCSDLPLFFFVFCHVQDSVEGSVSVTKQRSGSIGDRPARPTLLEQVLNKKRLVSLVFWRFWTQINKGSVTIFACHHCEKKSVHCMCIFSNLKNASEMCASASLWRILRWLNLMIWSFGSNRCGGFFRVNSAYSITEMVLAC